MCVVIDINTLAPVFNEDCKEHINFQPVREWIERGFGFLVFGGTRYKKELGKAYRYLRLVRLMQDRGWAVSIKDQVVDDAEMRIAIATMGTNCDDQHIIALLGASGCSLFCSKDSHSYEFIKDRRLYPKKMRRIRIYSSARNRGLLKPMRREALRNQG